MRTNWCIIVGSGPSMSQSLARQIERDLSPRLQALLIAVNSSVYSFSSVDVLFAQDIAWFEKNISPLRSRRNYKAAVCLGPYGSMYGVACAAPAIRSTNSGLAAAKWAILKGYTKIALFGMDCSASPGGEFHYHPDHVGLNNPYPQLLNEWAVEWDKWYAEVSDKVQVFNLSPVSTIQFIPKVGIQDLI